MISLKIKAVKLNLFGLDYILNKQMCLITLMYLQFIVQQLPDDGPMSLVFFPETSLSVCATKFMPLLFTVQQATELEFRL